MTGYRTDPLANTRPWGTAVYNGLAGEATTTAFARQPLESGPINVENLTAVDPPGLTVTPTASTTATLNWSAALLAGVTDYQVFRRTPPTGVPFVPGVDTPVATGVTALTYPATGLTPATAYEWQVFGRVPDAGPTLPILTNLIGQWDASNAASITASSGAVSQWNDLSGNGYHVVQATGSNQPITGTRTVNSRNVLDFQGAQSLVNNSFVALGNVYSVYVVARADGGGRVVGTAQTIDAGDWNTNQAVDACDIDNGGAYYNSTNVVSGAAFGTALFQYTLIAAPSFSGRKNGTALTATGTSGSLSTVQLRFGRNTPSDGFFDGVICEVVIYNVAHNTTDRDTIESYLKTKWGTP